MNEERKPIKRMSTDTIGKILIIDLEQNEV